VRIGDLQLDNDVALAPMAAVTNAPFRALAKEMGCGLTVTEMVSSEALVRGKGGTDLRMERAPGEWPLSIQLFGCDPAVMAEAAGMVEDAGAEIVDVNMGCPVDKIAGRGGGVALMREPSAAAAIVAAMAKRVRIPVTAKIRAGWDDAHLNAPEVARALEDAGAKAIAVHARTKEQVHAGAARWDVVARVKASVRVPVIGNGGIRGAADARAMKESTGCDGVMVARGAQGNPWIFRSILAGEDLPPTRAERFAAVRGHLRHYVEYAGMRRAATEMRKHLCWYLRGLPGAAQIRDHLHRLDGEREYLDLLGEYEASLASVPEAGGDPAWAWDTPRTTTPAVRDRARGGPRSPHR
jgi:nifR3 family TIM-barrel protein